MSPSNAPRSGSDPIMTVRPETAELKMSDADITTLDELTREKEEDAATYGARQFQSGLSDYQLEMSKRIELRSRREAVLLRRLLEHFRGY